jgi:hypothetical protein
LRWADPSEQQIDLRAVRHTRSATTPHTAARSRLTWARGSAERACDPWRAGAVDIERGERTVGEKLLVHGSDARPDVQDCHPADATGFQTFDHPHAL